VSIAVYVNPFQSYSDDYYYYYYYYY